MKSQPPKPGGGFAVPHFLTPSVSRQRPSGSIPLRCRSRPAMQPPTPKTNCRQKSQVGTTKSICRFQSRARVTSQMSRDGSPQTKHRVHSCLTKSLSRLEPNESPGKQLWFVLSATLGGPSVRVPYLHLLDTGFTDALAVLESVGPFLAPSENAKSNENAESAIRKAATSCE